MSPRPLVLLLLPLLACGQQLPASGSPVVPPPVVAPAPAAVVTLTPPPGPFLDRVQIQLATDIEATVTVSLDGSDPHHPGPAVHTGPSPLAVSLNQTATLTYFAKTSAGTESAVATAQYIRAGGPAGSISGVVVVGTFALKKEVGLRTDGAVQKLGSPQTETEIPFQVTGLKSGDHRLVALSDRDDDGNFIPLVDYQSEATVVTLDLKDPFKASAEHVRLFLGTSPSTLATLKGTVTLPNPAIAQNLSITALGSDLLSAGQDPTLLLKALQSGDRLFTRPDQTEYPYVITNLEPGRYIPAPVLTGFGGGGLSLNFIVNPFKSVQLDAGDTKEANFKFGPINLSGTVTLTPVATPASTPAKGFVYGIVAAKHASLGEGLQAVLMPTVFFPGAAGEPLKGNYAGAALRDGVTFQLKAFTSLDAQNPITAALSWAINPFAPGTQVTVATAGVDVKKDLTVP